MTRLLLAIAVLVGCDVAPDEPDTCEAVAECLADACEQAYFDMVTRAYDGAGNEYTDCLHGGGAESMYCMAEDDSVNGHAWVAAYEYFASNRQRGRIATSCELTRQRSESDKPESPKH